MAQLLFIEDEHKYMLDGSEVPSVTYLLRFLSRETYADVAQQHLDNAAKRGTRVHKQLESLDRYGECEADAETEPFIRAYIKFRREHTVEWLDIEKPIVNEQLRYAGTPDRRGMLDGKLAILDIKAQSNIHVVMAKAQLNAYNLAQSEPHELYILQLLNTGKYRLYPCSVDPTEFMACYNLHTAFKRKRERGRIS